MSGREAATAPDAPDERLRGRTFAIPFEQVWQAALSVAGGGKRGWRILDADDQAGVIRAEARGFAARKASSVTIRIGLDHDAQTRVDGRSAVPDGGPRFGAHVRRLREFFRALDQTLARRATAPGRRSR